MPPSFPDGCSLYILQSTLVRTHNVGLHRKLGWFGVALGITIPVLGISTAITMARLRIFHFNQADAEFGEKGPNSIAACS